MKSYQVMTKEELMTLREELRKSYEDAKGLGLKLDMSRGKPAADQLDLSMEMMETFDRNTVPRSEDGTDCRNYGALDGVIEAKRLMAAMIGCRPEQTVVCGNASLNVMYDLLARAELFGILGETPWSKLPKVTFLCPVPGYDRHFRMTEAMGIDMINIPMNEDGPDMDLVEKLVSEDETVKGIWCVPRFSNPGGVVYSDEVVRRMAALKPAARDFRIFWDNAYAVHDLYEEDQQQILEILSECEKAGNPDMVYEIASTSKVTFPGAGISVFAASPANLEEFKQRMGVQTISYDKINMLRHVGFLKDLDTLKAHMRKQADLIRPKFEAVEDILDQELGGLEIGTWTKPRGGYFISFQAMNGCAKQIVARCKEAGVILTGAGAAYPYGLDPDDSNIRIAPTYPTLEEMKQATKLFSLCVKLVSVEKLLENQ
ncbi:MAG: aminotransferase [Lachnospiraceae bacterium]|nr:aminotransferase [Lachnospiraceae bacterium]